MGTNVTLEEEAHTTIYLSCSSKTEQTLRKALLLWHWEGHQKAEAEKTLCLWMAKKKEED
jgi:hypothetical protein